MALFFILVIGLVIFMAAAFWKIYEKAGQPGWAAIVPFYNLYILTKIIGKPGWWFVMFLIPVVQYVFLVWAYNLLSKSFGKDEGFTVGLIFLSFIFFPILGFGSAQYIGAQSKEAKAALQVDQLLKEG